MKNTVRTVLTYLGSSTKIYEQNLTSKTYYVELFSFIMGTLKYYSQEKSCFQFYQEKVDFGSVLHAIGIIYLHSSVHDTILLSLEFITLLCLQTILQTNPRTKHFGIMRKPLPLEPSVLLREANRRRASLSVGNMFEMFDSRPSFVDG